MKHSVQYICRQNSSMHMKAFQDRAQYWYVLQWFQLLQRECLRNIGYSMYIWSGRVGKAEHFWQISPYLHHRSGIDVCYIKITRSPMRPIKLSWLHLIRSKWSTAISDIEDGRLVSQHSPTTEQCALCYIAAFFVWFERVENFWDWNLAHWYC